jgi:hypothetical protein
MKNAAERLPRYEIIRIASLVIAKETWRQEEKRRLGTASVSEYGSGAAS